VSSLTPAMPVLERWISFSHVLLLSPGSRRNG
jgi:hypothetical protein